MLTQEEYDRLNDLFYGGMMATTATMGLLAVKEAGQTIRKSAKGNPPLFGFGSRLAASNSGKIMALKFSDVFLEDINDEEAERWTAKVATIVASGLLGTTYELLSDQHRDRHNPSPLWEFVRHSRHACFHGNRFNLLGSEPRHPAIWRGLEITQALNGSPYFFDFLQFSDVFFLVNDLILEIGLPNGARAFVEELDPGWIF